MQSDWAVRNCTKIGTDTLYIEIVMDLRPCLAENSAREISGPAIQLKRFAALSWPDGRSLVSHISHT
jgi:hypothetical protein